MSTQYVQCRHCGHQQSLGIGVSADCSVCGRPLPVPPARSNSSFWMVAIALFVLTFVSMLTWSRLTTQREPQIQPQQAQLHVDGSDAERINMLFLGLCERSEQRQDECASRLLKLSLPQARVELRYIGNNTEDLGTLDHFIARCRMQRKYEYQVVSIATRQDKIDTITLRMK